MLDAQFIRSAVTTRILALDIAKRETGFAIIDVPHTPGSDDRIVWQDWGRFKTDVRNDKMMFAIGQEIAVQVMAEIRDARAAGVNLHIIIEHPVFGNTRSEQQYLLFQSVLAVCLEQQVNVTSVTPNFLKSFIKHQFPDAGQPFIAAYNARRDATAKAAGKKPKKVKKTRFGLTLEKEHIKEAYITVTAPAHPDWPHPDRIGNDDEYDAIYLAVLGALFCGDVPDLILPVIEMQIAQTTSVDQLYSLPYVLSSQYVNPQVFLPIQPRQYLNLHWYDKGLKEVVKNFRNNSHRKLEGKLDYLFNQLTLAQMVYAKHVELDPKGAKELTKKWGSKRTLIDQDPEAILNVNYAGQFYCHTPLRRVSAVE